jgi:hypothetical protein
VNNQHPDTILLNIRLPDNCSHNVSRRLPEKIEDDPGDPHWIITVRGIKYKFQA